MDALSSRTSQGIAPPPALPRGADHIAPDCSGQNFYAIDRGRRDLLAHYLTTDDFRRLEPHFDRLGALAGGRLDELARIADRHPPVLHPRDRFGATRILSTITPPTARWSRSPSATSSSTP
jgi:acyl-CoA dehydrogenase